MSDIKAAIKRARLLPPRQKAVLRALTAGKERKEIADQLGITAKTVEGYCTNLYAALGVNNCREAVAVGIKVFGL